MAKLFVRTVGVTVSVAGLVLRRAPFLRQPDNVF